MPLHIILGLSDKKPTSDVSVVYAGRSGSDASAAMKHSTAPHFLIISNPLGIPKNNPLAAANAAARAAKKAAKGSKAAS